VGGHTYGTTYAGPIGAVITPNLREILDWKHLAFASSLCGACAENCPVKIDLHHHLLQIRRNSTRKKSVWWEKLAFKMFTPLATNRTLWSLTTKLGRIGQIFHRWILGTRIDPAYAWTKTRDLPPIAKQSFKEWWKQRS
jgi:L-lactate dehydrogenase complex protein LldF